MRILKKITSIVALSFVLLIGTAQIAPIISQGSLSAISWGQIIGTLSDQEDLQDALDLKQDKPVSDSHSTDYTLDLGDAGNFVELTGTTPRTFTVPPNGTVAYPINTFIYLYRSGTSSTPLLTVAQGSGVTVTGTANVLTDPGQNVIMTLLKTGTNTWKLQNGAPSLTWTTFTPTLTGFSSTTTNTGAYIIEGKKCNFWINVAGTAAGSSPTSTVTNMPGTANVVWTNVPIVVNNATAQAGRADISAGSTVMTVFATPAQGNFTSSVARQFYIYGTYEIQ